MTARKARKGPPWTRWFVEIALRGVLRHHMDYLRWSIPQSPGRTVDPRGLTRGPGVACADELSVCAAIAHEFLECRQVWGGVVTAEVEAGVQEGPRFYTLKREVDIQGTGKRADFVVERVHTDGNPAGDGHPSYIEAKRAFPRTTHLGGGDVVYSQAAEVRKDIEKLRVDFPRDSTGRGFVLLWNVADRETSTWVSPSAFLDHAVGGAMAGDFMRRSLVRCAPLSASVELDGSEVLDSVAVDQWIWVLLAEVTEPKVVDAPVW